MLLNRTDFACLLRAYVIEGRMIRNTDFTLLNPDPLPGFNPSITIHSHLLLNPSHPSHPFSIIPYLLRLAIASKVMASDDSSNSFQNVFDEQECRDFLAYELGEEIPILYRYREGIHEVQKRIILRYGDMNYGKAMKVFNQLLECDNCASGLGDAGDPWRSWRHDYKNRGVSGGYLILRVHNQP